MQKHWTKFGDGRVRVASSRRSGNIARRRQQESTQEAHNRPVLTSKLNKSFKGRNSVEDPLSDNCLEQPRCAEEALNRLPTLPGESRSASLHDKTRVTSRGMTFQGARSNGEPCSKEGDDALCLQRRSNLTLKRLPPKPSRDYGHLRRDTVRTNSADPPPSLLRRHYDKASKMQPSSKVDMRPPLAESRRSSSSGNRCLGTVRSVDSRSAVSGSPGECEVGRHAKYDISYHNDAKSRGPRMSLPREDSSRDEESDSGNSSNSEMSSEASGVSWLDFSNTHRREARTEPISAHKDVDTSRCVEGQHGCGCQKWDYCRSANLGAGASVPETRSNYGSSSHRVKPKLNLSSPQSTAEAAVTGRRDSLVNTAGKWLRRISFSSAASNQREEKGSRNCSEVNALSAIQTRRHSRQGVSGSKIKQTLVEGVRGILSRSRRRSDAGTVASDKPHPGALSTRETGHGRLRSCQDQTGHRDRLEPHWKRCVSDSNPPSEAWESSLPPTPTGRSGNGGEWRYNDSDISHDRESSVCSEEDFMDANRSDRDELQQPGLDRRSSFKAVAATAFTASHSGEFPPPSVNPRRCQASTRKRTSSTPSRVASDYSGDMCSGPQQTGCLEEKVTHRGTAEAPVRRLSAASTSPSRNQDTRSDRGSLATSDLYVDENASKMSVLQRKHTPERPSKQSSARKIPSIPSPIVTLEHVNASIDWIVNVGSNQQLMQKAQEMVRERLQKLCLNKRLERGGLSPETPCAISAPNYVRVNRPRLSSKAATTHATRTPIQLPRSSSLTSGRGRFHEAKPPLREARTAALPRSWGSADLPLLDPSCEGMISAQLEGNEDTQRETERPKDVVSVKHFRVKAKNRHAIPLYVYPDLETGLDSGF